MCEIERNENILDICYLKLSDDEFHWQFVNMMHKIGEHEKNLTIELWSCILCICSLKKLWWVGQSCPEFEQIIWVTNDIRPCHALIILDNYQR